MMLYRAILTTIGVSFVLCSCSGDENTDSKPSSRSKKTNPSDVSTSATTDGFDTGFGIEDNPTGNTKRKKKAAKGSFEDLLSHPDRNLKECVEVYLPTVQGEPTSLDYMKGAIIALDDKHRDYDGAEVLLTEIIRLEPDNGQAYYLRGRSRCNTLELKDDQALQDFARARSLGVRADPMYEYEARIYEARHQTDKALEALSKAIKLDPKERNYYRSRASLYVSLNKKELAKKDYDKAIELDPKESYVYLMRGQLLESMQLNDAALKDYIKAADSSLHESRFGKRVIAFKGQALLLQKLGRYEEAIKALESGSNLEKNDEELWALRGQCYAALKKYDRAIAAYSRSIELAPTFSSKTYLDRSKAYEQIGKKELAEKDRLEAKRLQAEPAEKQMYEIPKQPGDKN